jgi:hypothetical protein
MKTGANKFRAAPLEPTAPRLAFTLAWRATWRMGMPVSTAWTMSSSR